MQRMLIDGQVSEAEEQLALAHAAQPAKGIYVKALADCIAHSQRDHARSLPWYSKALLLEASNPQVQQLLDAGGLVPVWRGTS